MTHKTMKLAAAVAASAAALLMGCEAPSSTVQVDFTVDVTGVVRPAGSGVSIVGNAFSLGATAEKPEGDPTRGLKLRLQPDGTWRGSAWVQKPDDPMKKVTYTVYMSNPFAPEIATAGGPPVSHDVDFASATGESVAVAAFDVPQNIVKPCVDFTVYVPPGTPDGDPVYIAGNDDQLGPWTPGKQALEDNGDGTYSVHLCFDSGKELQYKYVRSNGDWSKVEKNTDGTERANRTLTVTEDVSRNDTVEKWADI
jgi:hypothetical protein